MKNFKLFKVGLLALLLIFLSGIITTAVCQDDYEGTFLFNSITKGYEYDAPDQISLSKYDGDQATIYRKKKNRFGYTNDFDHVSTGVFEIGFGLRGYYSKTLGERITFLSYNKLTYLNTQTGVKATYVRK
ncbi:MAG: hypothetical protein NTV87_17340 [Ignavibacteriae bacterium]|nr:hypothetical protein [Ignavibacteriota bacterium]